MRKIILLITLALLSLLTLSARAESEENKIPPSLDTNLRELWTTRNEFYLFAGDYFADSLKNSYIFGGDYTYRISKNIGLGGSFGYSRANYGDNKFYEGFFPDKNLYVIDAVGTYSCPLIYLMGSHLFEADLIATVGVGATKIASGWKPHGFVGGGVRLYFGIPWLAFRIDIRDTFHSTPRPNQKDAFDEDLLFLFGFTFEIPPKIK